jgi:hypothetical protein
MPAFAGMTAFLGPLKKPKAAFWAALANVSLAGNGHLIKQGRE